MCVPVSLGTGRTSPLSGSSRELYDARGSGVTVISFGRRELRLERTESRTPDGMMTAAIIQSIMLYMSEAQHNLGHIGSDQ